MNRIQTFTKRLMTYQIGSIALEVTVAADGSEDRANIRVRWPGRGVITEASVHPTVGELREFVDAVEALARENRGGAA